MVPRADTLLKGVWQQPDEIVSLFVMRILATVNPPISMRNFRQKRGNYNFAIFEPAMAELDPTVIKLLTDQANEIIADASRRTRDRLNTLIVPSGNGSDRKPSTDYSTRP
jgi:hypothetical protein